MKYVLFYHSFLSCWNHGNAHFLRGIARALIRQGHQVVCYEPRDGWSRTNLLRDHGPDALLEGGRLIPGVLVRSYDLASLDLDGAFDGADVVLVHEWNDPRLVARIGEARLRGGRFALLFHDTHHRAVSDRAGIDAFELEGYDGILAFGEVLREIYLERGWGRRVFTWHEAADWPLFESVRVTPKDTDLIWIGNWGDGERDEELQQFLIDPVSRMGLSARVHGVRYPAELRARLRNHGISYGGWLPNAEVPGAFARSRVTVHIPRRPYVAMLPGIPTIRVFEALAAGIPLVSAPWPDTEGLFPKGSYLVANTGAAMSVLLAGVLRDPQLAAELSRVGRAAIQASHTCEHRVEQLRGIVEGLRAPGVAPVIAETATEKAPA
jgi:spore maturation protein CgeB